MVTQNWESEIRRLEEAVNKGDGDGLRARWASGRYMLTLKNGRKLLPRGTLGGLAKELGVHRSELSARMKFGQKYPTEEQLSNVIRQFPTWYELKRKALTDNPRQTDADDKPGNSKLRRALGLVEGIDPATLGDDDDTLLKMLEASIRRLVGAVSTLKEAA